MTDNIVLAAKAGYFGLKRDKAREKAIAPYAVYLVEGGKYKYLAQATAKIAQERAQAIATRRGWEWDDRTQEATP